MIQRQACEQVLQYFVRSIGEVACKADEETSLDGKSGKLLASLETVKDPLLWKKVVAKKGEKLVIGLAIVEDYRLVVLTSKLQLGVHALCLALAGSLGMMVVQSYLPDSHDLVA